MPRQCILKCPKSKNVSLFSFPRGQHERKRWMENLRVREDGVNRSVCARHFDKKVLNPCKNKVHDGGIPTLHLGWTPKHPMSIQWWESDEDEKKEDEIPGPLRCPENISAAVPQSARIPRTCRSLLRKTIQCHEDETESQGDEVESETALHPLVPITILRCSEDMVVSAAHQSGRIPPSSRSLLRSRLPPLFTSDPLRRERDEEESNSHIQHLERHEDETDSQEDEVPRPLRCSENTSAAAHQSGRIPRACRSLLRTPIQRYEDETESQENEVESEAAPHPLIPITILRSSQGMSVSATHQSARIRTSSRSLLRSPSPLFTSDPLRSPSPSLSIKEEIISESSPAQKAFPSPAPPLSIKEEITSSVSPSPLFTSDPLRSPSPLLSIEEEITSASPSPLFTSDPLRSPSPLLSIKEEIIPESSLAQEAFPSPSPPLSIKTGRCRKRNAHTVDVDESFCEAVDIFKRVCQAREARTAGNEAVHAFGKMIVSTVSAMGPAKQATAIQRVTDIVMELQREPDNI